MAGIVWNKGESSAIQAWLSAVSDSGTPKIIPAIGGNWGLGLGTRVGGVGSTKADAMAQIIEIGTGTANGYARAAIVRDQNAGGWPAPSLISLSYASTAAQDSFTFTNAPTPNGATLWFVAGNVTIGEDNALFGADTAATRTFGNGDTERVTPTYRQT